MDTYLLTLGKGLKGPTHLHGALFVGERTLSFLCTSVGRLENTDYGAFGSVGKALDAYRKTGAPPAIDESELQGLIASTPHSFSVDATGVEKLSRSMWTGSKVTLRNSDKLVVWNPGFAGPFRTRMRDWAQRNGVASSGL